MAFLRNGWVYVRIPQQHGADKIRATKGTDLEYGKDIEAACRLLKRNRDWKTLRGIAHGTPTMDEVRDAYARGDVAGLAAVANDVDLEPYVAEWRQSLVLRFGDGARPGVDASRTTPEHYTREVRRLIPEGQRFPRSRFTAGTVRAYLATRPGKPATKVRAKAALSSFANFLIGERVLTENPCRAVPLARVKTPPPSYLALHEIERLLTALADEPADPKAGLPALPARTMETFAHATGMEVMALRLLRRRDVDLKRARVRAPGTKTETRDRYAAIDPWALPALRAYFTTGPGRALKPGDLVFPILGGDHDGHDARGYQRLKQRHQTALKRAELPDDYTLHDARHSWAVRHVAAGVPIEYVGAQLGHQDPTMTVEVYGRFRPAATDTARYQALAAARDAELRADVDDTEDTDEPDAATPESAADTGPSEGPISQIPLHAAPDAAEPRGTE
jgi:integrase